MAGNTLLTTAQITYEVGYTFVNNLVFARKVFRGYDDRFAQSGAKIGDTIHLRMPIRPVPKRGRVANVQDIVETSVPLTLSNQVNISLTWTSADEALSMDDFRRRYITPAVVPIANMVDMDGLALYYQIANTAGTPGVVPNSTDTYLDAGVRMSNEATLQDNTWCAVLNPRSSAKIAGALLTNFNPQKDISDIYESGRIGPGMALNFNWYQDQNVAVHTVGPLGGTPIVTVAGQTGASLLTSGWTAAAAARLKRGDVFTIAGVYSVNPVSRQSTGELRQFVVTADVSSDGSGLATIPIFPAITPPAANGDVVQFQTVTASPSASAALTILGAANTLSAQNLLFHPMAFALGTADLPPPRSGRFYRINDREAGIAMRVWESSNWEQDTHGTRIDILYGWAVPYPTMASRVAA